jgi:hypothetical protein
MDAKIAATRSAGFQTCRIADFRIGWAAEIVRRAGLETRDTADLEVCATAGAVPFAISNFVFMVSFLHL